MRLFVALELPAEAVEALVAWQASVLAGRPGLRGVRRDSLHVTLCFLGEQAADAVAPIAQALGPLAGSGRPPLALGEPWWLPRRRPRVLACAIADDSGALREAQSLLVAALRRAVGFEPERRAFFPHVTVARVRSGARVRPAPLEGAPGVEFAGTRVTLFRSVLGGGGGSEGGGSGSRYEPLHSVEL